MFFSVVICFPFLFFDVVSARFVRRFLRTTLTRARACISVRLWSCRVQEVLAAVPGLVTMAVDYLVFQLLRVFAPLPLVIGTRVISLFFYPADSPPTSAGEGSLRLSG